WTAPGAAAPQTAPCRTAGRSRPGKRRSTDAVPLNEPGPGAGGARRLLDRSARGAALLPPSLAPGATRVIAATGAPVSVAVAAAASRGRARRLPDRDRLTAGRLGPGHLGQARMSGRGLDAVRPDARLPGQPVGEAALSGQHQRHHGPPLPRTGGAPAAVQVALGILGWID